MTKLRPLRLFLRLWLFFFKALTSVVLRVREMEGKGEGDEGW
jgi:hypothetical protein